MLIPILFAPRIGGGYIAGEPPGIVTINTSPARATVDLYIRSSRQWVRSTRSDAQGRYAFEGLDTAIVYDVIGRDPSNTYNDVIMSRISPQPYA